MNETTHDFPKLFETLLEVSMCKIIVMMHETVRVPDHLRKQEVVPFNLSWRFEAPMEILNDGIAASLRFNEDWFDCWFPYDKVIGVIQMSTGNRWVFGMESVGGEAVRIALLRKAGPASNPKPSSHLRVVK